MFNSFSLGKLAVQGIAALSVGKVIQDVIKNNTTIVTRLDQIRVTTGGFILGTIVVDKASQQVSKLWNGAVAEYQKRENEKKEEDAKEK
jgi:hypothetical protein